MDLIPYAVPFFFLAIAIELVYGWLKRRNTYRINDSVGSLFMGTLSTASKLVLIGLGGAVFAAIEQHYSLWRMDTGAWATWVFAFVAYDLCYYWFHRISHERQIFWASHVAHHQSEEYNLTTALRQTSTGFLLGWIFYIPVFLVGVPAEVFVTVASANLIYQYWVHTEHVPKLGWYEWIFVTPSNHRVHHAQNDIYMDRNYGGVFILWDRFFGTFQEEREDQPCIYGIRGPLLTFSRSGPICISMSAWLRTPGARRAGGTSSGCWLPAPAGVPPMWLFSTRVRKPTWPISTNTTRKSVAPSISMPCYSCWQY